MQISFEKATQWDHRQKDCRKKGEEFSLPVIAAQEKVGVEIAFPITLRLLPEPGRNIMKSTGFTFIELMFIVAIMGILTAIAIPSYQRYVLKTQINRVVGELSVYKSPFEERLGSSGSVTNSQIGYTPSNLTTGSQAVDVAAFNADGSGQLQVTMGGAKPTQICQV
ncbi:pilin [Marinobacter sp. S0848L]|uniref:pilin n=1 Tax=Marinobacter sp. S0848L TaxID=2926423 RepID=UPI00248C7F70|nr:pilin [Marinobacter sp. S0848L]